MSTVDVTGKLHDVLSQRVLIPLAHARRIARPATRPAMNAFLDGLRFREATVTWAENQKREWMLGRLRTIVRRAAQDTVYYRDLFNRIGFDPNASFTFDDFARLPVLDRDDVRRAGLDLVSSAVEPDRLKKDSTGGSSGKPTEVWLGAEERGWRDSSTEHFMRRIGLPAGTRTAYLWGHHLDPVAQESLRERYQTFESNAMWFDCFRLSPDRLEHYHQIFERRRPACIIAYAGALGNLAEHLLTRGHRPGYPSSALVTGAEKLLPSHRDAVAKAFNRPVHERYGGRDVGGLAFQLTPERTLDYTVDWANTLLEPETAEEDSSILVTKLHADGMPMLRYRVGDIGRFARGSRPGHPAFTLHEVLGRLLDRIWLPNGSWLHGIQLPHLMKDYPVREFMFHQRADYTVEVQVVPHDRFDDQARTRILETIAANLPGIDVSLSLVESIPRTRANKWRPVMTEVQPTAGGHV
jgi:phenylacetate-coenzyme A ligase PaaK-like adenylate-forming protein